MNSNKGNGSLYSDQIQHVAVEVDDTFLVTRGINPETVRFLLHEEVQASLQRSAANAEISRIVGDVARNVMERCQAMVAKAKEARLHVDQETNEEFELLGMVRDKENHSTSAIIADARGVVYTQQPTSFFNSTHKKV